MKSILLSILVFSFLVPIASAQELYQDFQGTFRAKVLAVKNVESILVPGTDVASTVQTLEVIFLEGPRKDQAVTFENDYIQLEKGDVFYLDYLVSIDGVEHFVIREMDRRIPLAIVVGLFALTVLVFGGMQGLRSLVSLGASLLVIIYALVPALVEGYSPVLVSTLVATVVLFCAIFFTHGFNRSSAIAFCGTLAAVGVTGLLAWLSIAYTSLSGLSSDETVYLNLNTRGELDLVGLLLAAIIIGALGVLDDIAITQVAVVEELYKFETFLTKWDIYRRAIRVGKEHVGALVNTLVLAYAGASLPLLLLFSLSDSSWLSIVNREVFATEIVRSMVGGIGLVLTVPITTLLAVLILSRHRPKRGERDELLDTERPRIHAHGHHH